MKVIELTEDNFLTILTKTDIRPLRLAKEIEKAIAANEKRYLIDQFVNYTGMFTQRFAIISEVPLSFEYEYDLTTISYKWTEIKPR